MKNEKTTVALEPARGISMQSLIDAQFERLKHGLKLHCYRCGSEWNPKDPGKFPTVCADCKNPRWYIPRPNQSDRKEVTQREKSALDIYLSLIRTGSPKAKLLRELVELEAAEGGKE